MSVLLQLEEAYASYAQQVHEAAKKSTVIDRFVGSANDPRNHPSHQEFYKAVEQLVEGFAQTQPSAEEAMPVARWLLETAAAHRDDNHTYWYLYAIQTHAQKLIGLLRPADCRALAESYQRLHPKYDRMPAQEKLFKALRKAAKEKKA